MPTFMVEKRTMKLSGLNIIWEYAKQMLNFVHVDILVVESKGL